MANKQSAKKTARRAVLVEETKAPARKTTAVAKTPVEGDPPADSPMNKAFAGLTQGPATQQEAVKQAKRSGEDIVTVVVPKAFKLTDDKYRLFEYEAGVIDMPLSHAEHKYSIANGVTIK